MIFACCISACGKENTSKEQEENENKVLISEAPKITESITIKEEIPIAEDAYEYTSLCPRIEEKEAVFATSLSQAVIYRGEYATYYFDKDLAPELRDKFVRTSEQIVTFLAEYMAFKSPLEVYAVDNTYFYNSETGKCSVSSQYAGTSVQAAILLQAAIGSSTVNFGLLQAEGFCIAQQFGWDTSYIPAIPRANHEDIAQPLAGKRYELEEDKNLLVKNLLSGEEKENVFLFDLEYPCFLPDYVEEEQVEAAWNLTKKLSTYILENKTQQEVLELLSSCNDLFGFEEGFTNLKNEWLKEIKSNLSLSKKEYPVQYGSCGRFVLLQMKTVHGKWYVLEDFDTALLEGEKYSWLFRKNYQGTNTLMCSLEKELTYVDEILKDKEYNYPEAEFYFKKDLGLSGASGLFKGAGIMYIKNLFSIVHEYCHYLMLQEGIFLENGKSKEVCFTQLHLLPHYYGIFSETAYLLFQNRYELVKEKWLNDEEIRLYLEILKDQLGGEIFICDRKSMTYFQHFNAALTRRHVKLAEWVTLKYSKFEPSWQGALSSFAIYIADTYGEDILYLVSTGNDKVEELTGHTIESLAKEWEEYLKELYPVSDKNIKEDAAVMAIPLGESIFVDLDGNGIKEKVTIGAKPSSNSDNPWRSAIPTLTIGEKTFEEKDFSEQIGTGELDAEAWYLLDIDKEDSYREIGVFHKYAPTGAETVLFRFQEGKLACIGRFDGRLLDAPIITLTQEPDWEKLKQETFENVRTDVVFGDGTIQSSMLSFVLDTDIISVVWKLEDAGKFRTKLVLCEQDYYEFALGENYQRVLKADCLFYAQRGEKDGNTVLIPAGTKVRFLRYDPKEKWFEITYNNNEKSAWFQVIKEWEGNPEVPAVLLLPEGETDADKCFTGLVYGG